MESGPYLFKKGDREDPGSYRGITLLSVVGKVVLNYRLVHCLDKEGVLHEGQAGFRVNRSCITLCKGQYPSTLLLYYMHTMCELLSY